MNTLKSLALTAALIVTGTWITSASAQTSVDQITVPTGQSGATAKDMSDGEVRKIDKDSKKVTLKHGAIKNLDMPGMTMVFQVKDASLLDKLEVGNKVKFSADSRDGAIVVTALEAVK